MTYEDMLSWSLFYSTLFEMHKTPMIDVIDPDGLVRSQALTTLNKSLRITLNGADTQRTLTDTFIAELKSLNILYDEDGNGQFLHCYGKQFSGNLFIEIQQRDECYDGYGGVNAPFRSAAQKRLDRSQNAK